MAAGTPTSYSTRVSYVQPNTGKTAILVDVIGLARTPVVHADLDLRAQTLDPALYARHARRTAPAGFLPPITRSRTGRGVREIHGGSEARPGDRHDELRDGHRGLRSQRPDLHRDMDEITSDAGPADDLLLRRSRRRATWTTPTFLVSWSGQDVPNGIGDLDAATILMSPFTAARSHPGLAATTATSAEYQGSPCDTYAFYSIASLQRPQRPAHADGGPGHDDGRPGPRRERRRRQRRLRGCAALTVLVLGPLADDSDPYGDPPRRCSSPDRPMARAG